MVQINFLHMHVYRVKLYCSAVCTSIVTVFDLEWSTSLVKTFLLFWIFFIEIGMSIYEKVEIKNIDRFLSCYFTSLELAKTFLRMIRNMKIGKISKLL